MSDEQAPTTPQSSIDNKCAILGMLWLFYRDTDNETWSEFFSWADLGLPLAHLHDTGLAELTDEGADIVEETWTVFCEMIDIDPAGKYTTLKEAFDASPNALLDDENSDAVDKPQ